MHYQQHLTQLITPNLLNYFLHLAHLPCWFSIPQILTTETLYKSGLGSPLLSSLSQSVSWLKIPYIHW